MLEPAYRALAECRRVSAPAIEALVRLSVEGRLGVPLSRVVTSLVHMRVNRIVRARSRAHEYVLYDALERLYRSECTRRR